ncbi:hypothetical protein [Actinophytocola sp.]|uniref:hypothetical protein n=1 Tax=Actinophytocola sp. TaxID=1872138 RepID=UPI002ED1B8CD
MSVSPRWAVLSGVAGLVANVLLILFFAVSRPWTSGGDLDWLGPANDATVVVQFAALVPVALAVRGRVGLARAVTATAVGAMGAVAVLQVALLVGVLTFDVQVWAVMACFAITFGWVLVASRAGRTALPRAVVRLGTAVGVSFLAGAAVFAAGALLLPPDSVALYVVCGAGVVVGLFGWLGFPVWPLVLALKEGQ